MLHFHRLEYQQCRATRNRLAWRDQYGDDPARHGCGEIACFFIGIGGIGGIGEWVAQRQAAVLCAMEDVKACAASDNGARYRIVVQPDGQPPAGQPFAAQAASNAA